MIDIAINVEPLYPEMDFCQKIERIKAAGFDAIEFWSWDDKDLDAISETCQRLGVQVKAFGGTTYYSLCDREHSSDCIEWIRKTAEAAKQLHCKNLILFPNHFTPSGCADFRDKYTAEAAIASITANLVRMVPILEENGLTALLEPLCNIGADAGMTVTDTSVGADIVRAVHSDHVKLLCDVYHMQVMHGNLQTNITKNTDIVPYIHIDDAPDRHEPGTGEINFRYLAQQIKESDFSGTVCMEYFPEDETEAGYPAVKEFCALLK